VFIRTTISQSLRSLRKFIVPPLDVPDLPYLTHLTYLTHSTTLVAASAALFPFVVQLRRSRSSSDLLSRSEITATL
jgi:hypothetical protein